MLQIAADGLKTYLVIVICSERPKFRFSFCRIRHCDCMNTEAAWSVCLISHDFRIRVDFHQMAALIVRIEICPNDVTWKFKFWKIEINEDFFYLSWSSHESMLQYSQRVSGSVV